MSARTSGGTKRKRRMRLLSSKEKLAEVEDSPLVFERKCQRLASLLRFSRCAVVYTGAGISTAASIPDYRGPNGLWTMAGKGITCHQACDPVSASPTASHLALRELFKRGYIRHLLSQNCDGFHLRSGLPQSALSEIHGNMHIEVCTQCQPLRQFIRPFDVTGNTRFRRHKTERRCDVCFSQLEDTIVHFGEHGKLRWPLNWDGVVEVLESPACDLILCLGTSLKILSKYRFLWSLERRIRDRPKLVIINLQWTPRDRSAQLKIQGKCDDVMKRVLEIFHLQLPVYCRLCDPVLNCRRRTTRNKELLDRLTECVCPEGAALQSWDAPTDEERKTPGWWTAGLLCHSAAKRSLGGRTAKEKIPKKRRRTVRRRRRQSADSNGSVGEEDGPSDLKPDSVDLTAGDAVQVSEEKAVSEQRPRIILTLIRDSSSQAADAYSAFHSDHYDVSRVLSQSADRPFFPDFPQLGIPTAASASQTPSSMEGVQSDSSDEDENDTSRSVKLETEQDDQYFRSCRRPRSVQSSL